MAKQPILIVGAGPTGLVLALWLTKAGIPVRIIDKTDQPGTTSRALVLHARNLEFYRQLGIDRLTLERGIEVKAVNLWLSGNAVGRLPFSNPGATITPFPYALNFPQDLHEQMLVEELEKLGVEIERGTTLLDFTSNENGLEAKIQKKSGEIDRQQFAYLAGCDGAHSTVREKLGIGFPGGTYDDIYYVADIVGSGPVFNGELNIALDDADFLAIFPMKGEGRIRLVGAVRKKLQEKKDLHWEDVSQRVAQHLKLAVHEVKWFSTYQVHHRVAGQFQKGGAFLLGDAAHIHSPVGGQGMNTGIGDAVNLAWKLAAVMKGRAPADLLQTYEPERIAFARRLVATTDRAFAFVSARGPIATQVRLHVVPKLLPFLFQFAAVRRFMFRSVSQIWLKYPQSPLSHGPPGTNAGGKRLPWVQFKDSSGNTADNFSALGTRDWQVHCYGEATPVLQETCDERELKLHVFPWSAAAEKAGLKKNAAYIVRPDGYIGIIDPQADPKRISQYLDRWVIKSSFPAERYGLSGEAEESSLPIRIDHQNGDIF